MAARLDSMKDESQLRSLEQIRGINLCSNDYLGLATNRQLKKAVVEAVTRAKRVGSTGSRLLSGNSREWEQLELKFAEFAGTESALYFGSGYAANIGLLSSLLKPDDFVFSDSLNHASLIDGIRLSRAEKVIYPHCDLQFLEHALRDVADTKDASGARIIVTESLFSMEGDVAPLEELLDLARRYGAELVVDEAHATGVCGPRGRGIAASLGIESDVFATVHTCGKALASVGAFVCGSAALRDFLINAARTFIFSTAMPPYMAGQIEAAFQLASGAEEEREHLRAIASTLRDKLARTGLNASTGKSHIVPVILGTNELALHVAGELQNAGFAVKAIRPPTVPPGAARIRISLTANISMDDVRRLADAITTACKLSSRELLRKPMHA